MAHNLNVNKTKVSFASRQEKAWHGLGTVVEAMNSEQAIILGGLDFEVEKRPIYVNGNIIPFIEARQHREVVRSLHIDDNNVTTPIYKSGIIIPDKFATVRTDNNAPLGIVGSKYHVIQNHEAFSFIDSIIGEGQADYETVGCLGQGETVFITCKLKEEMIINKDHIDKYLLLSMSHDGSSSINVLFTPIRVVCNNTLSLALKAGSNKFTIRHTKNAKDKLEYAKKVLGLVDRETLAYKEAFGHLAKITVFDTDVPKIIKSAFKIKEDEYGDISSRSNNVVRDVLKYYNIGVGQEDIKGTAWGVFNGITGYLQNGKSYTDSETKFKNTFMTSGAEIRNRTFELLVNH